MPDEIAQILAQAPVFAGVEQPALAAVAALAERLAYQEGDAVYGLGDEAEKVYLVESGRVRFTMGVGNRPGAGQSVIAEGQIFGWAALVEDQPRRLATAVCLEDTSVLALDGRRLLELFDAHPAAGYLLMRRLAAMIANDLIEMLAV